MALDQGSANGARAGAAAAAPRPLPASPPETHSLPAEAAGGAARAIASFTLALSLGVLAYAPLGPRYTSVGLLAGFASAIWGQLVAGLPGSRIHPGSGPRASATLILSGFVAVLAGDPAVAPNATRGAELVVALVALVMMLAGAMQLLFAWLRIGQLARYVPYPFVAGFMCGVAALIVLAQIEPLTGLSADTVLAGVPELADAFAPGALIVGLATAAITLVVDARAKHLPAALLGIVAGTLLFHGLRFAVPQFDVGASVGVVPNGLPLPLAPSTLADMPLAVVTSRLTLIVSTAMLIAIVSTLDTLFAAVYVDHVTGSRHAARPMLAAHGLANIASGACGGAPVVYSPVCALASWRAGGRTWRSLVIGVALVAAIAAAGGPILGFVPIAVIAGIMLTQAVGLVDDWTRGAIARWRGNDGDPTTRLAVLTIVAVAAATVAFGFLGAIAVGLGLSAILFIVTMNRTLVRAELDAAVRPSRRVWGGADAERIGEVRRRIRIIELDGVLFFGSAERLYARVEPLARSVDTVVLDFGRVITIDATGALLLERLVRHMERLDTRVLLAGVTPEGRLGRALLASQAFLDPGGRPWYRDADAAIEHAERRGLERLGRGPHDEIDPSAFALFAGLSAEAQHRASAMLRRLQYPRGQLLFREGDPGDRMYLIARGAIEISVMTGERQRTRIVTMAEGSLFGEAALLDGRARSATAVVVESAVLYEVTRESLDALGREQPDIALALLANLAREMSRRLRETTAVLRQAESGRR